MRSKSKGFTLVELVLTILILGILAVTALPRFADLSDEADQASFDAVKANFQTGVALVYSTSLIHKPKSSAGFPDVNLSGQCIRVNATTGYPLVDQSSGVCTPVASVLPLEYLAPEFAERLYAATRPLLNGPIPVFAQAHAAPAPAPPASAATELPGLLMDSEFTEWVWTITGPFGTLTSPDGLAFTYNENSGKVN